MVSTILPTRAPAPGTSSRRRSSHSPASGSRSSPSLARSTLSLRSGPQTASSPPWGARSCATGARPWRTISGARRSLRRPVLCGAATFASAVAQRVEARVEFRDEIRVRRVMQAVKLVGVFLEVVQLALPSLVLDVQVSLRPYGPVRRHRRYGPISRFVPLIVPVADLESRAPRGRIVTLRPVEQGSERAAIYGGRRRQARQVREGRGEVVVQDHLVPADPRRQSRSPDHQRYPYILFVGGFLAKSEAMLVHVIAVVAGEDNVGIV